MGKNVIISEEQYNHLINGLVNEGITDIVYHFTRLPNAYSIVSNDKFFLQNSMTSDREVFDNKRPFYMSCARVRNSKFGYPSAMYRTCSVVRFELDGRKLSEKFRGKPINFYRLRENSFESDETEDRIFSYQSEIEHAHKYVKYVDIFVSKNTFREDLKYIKEIYSNFLFHDKVRIFFRRNEFDSPNGKDSNEYFKRIIQDGSYEEANEPIDKRICRSGSEIDYVSEILAKAFRFIYGGKDIDHSIKEDMKNRLYKYDFGNFISLLPTICRMVEQMNTSKPTAIDLSLFMEGLSKFPNRYASKVSQMMVDYFRKNKKQAL